jgi:hypothetical protein
LGSSESFTHPEICSPAADTMNSLAMVEMTTLVAAVYRNYRTRVRKGMEDMSPGITSRFEVFYDETKSRVKVSLVEDTLLRICADPCCPIGTRRYD